MTNDSIVVRIGCHTFHTTRRPDNTYISEAVDEGVLLPPPLDPNRVLAIFPSKSSPDTQHYVKMSEQGPYCTCMGFVGHHHCWHTDLVKDVLDQGIVIDTPMVIRKETK